MLPALPGAVQALGGEDDGLGVYVGLGGVGEKTLLDIGVALVLLYRPQPHAAEMKDISVGHVSVQ
ncbi:hypothetical protein D3C71_1681020 [compost metagenome]